VNRPNNGGNIINNSGGNAYFGGNRNNFVNNGGWGSGWGAANGGWGGGYHGGGWGGYGQWGGRYSSPYYGNWYRGSWGGSGFWTGVGVGALTSYAVRGFGYAPAYYNAYSYFPTWGVSSYGTWGLDAMAEPMLAANYANPYYSDVVAAQPASTTIVYDYSQPINVAAAPADPTAAESTEQVFSAARDAFKAGDYPRALDLADQVLKQTPNAPVVHEFRALALFALARYDEAAAVAYAVLSTGPGWNWSTLVNLYPNVDTYTNQLRALEAYAKGHPESSSPQFLLGYHYMVQGHSDVAANQFEKVTKIQPNETLSASFVKALRKVSEAKAAAPEATPEPPDAPASPPAEEAAPSPPPAEMAGKWTAKPAPDVTITLSLQKDGTYAWEVAEKGRTQTLTGQASYKDNTLALLQDDGPPLVGKVTLNDNTFVFAPRAPTTRPPA
jgi:tetratricopeptide (TPR) repeat protein